VNLRRRLPMYIRSLRRLRPSTMTHSLQTRMTRKRKARLSCMHSASASVAREADIVICSQGTIYGRYWRGFFGSTRTWHCCRARPSLSIGPQTSPQRQEERQGPKRNVRDIILRHTLFLTHVFVTAQSPPNPHRRIPHRSRLFHLPRRPSRAR
jgi:hypothetical protein